MSLTKKLETKIPPPVVGLCTAALIWWLAQIFPSLRIIPADITKWGIILLAIGFSIDITALIQFFKQKTTPNPLSPNKTNTIVVSGLYRISRNPMYLGMLISLCGWVVYLGNIIGLICLPLFIGIINKLQILPEEKMLTAKFGESYRQYLARVRRWI